MKKNNLPGFFVYRNADGGGSGGASASVPAGGAPATVTTSTGGGSATATVPSAPSTMGEAATASQTQSSASATVPAIGQEAAKDTGAPDFKTSLGDYAKDPSLSDVADVQTLAKRFIDTKKLVGQKLGIPDANSTPEAKAAFYKAMGVPDNAEGYALKAPEKLPENLRNNYEAETLKEYTDVARKLNLTTEQAKGLQEWFDSKTIKQFESMQTDITKSDAEFDKLATKIFGDKKEEAIQNAKTLLVKHIPEELRKELDNLPNAALTAIAAALSGYSKEMSGEDKVIGTGGESASNQTPAQLREEAKKLMALPEYSSPFTEKGKAGHEALVAKVKKMYADIAELERGGKR